MSEKRVPALDSFVLERMQESHLPGVSLSLIRTEGARDTRAFGFRDLESRRAVTPRTLFGLGSITKLFTALAVFQLIERGLLSLDDPLADHLAVELRPGGEPVRIWHLLSHTSGIPALGFSESKMSKAWFMSGIPVASEEDLLAFMGDAAAWAVCPPGQRWFYLNEGYLLLGRLIARLSGHSYTSYIEQQILDPLGMERTFFATTRLLEHEADAATPYLRGRDGEFFVGAHLYGEMPAAGGLVSCAQDMERLARALLDEGRLPGGGMLISPDGLQQMRSPRVALPLQPAEIVFAPETTARSSYEGYFGCGLQIHRNFFGADLIGHGGGIMGGSSYLALMPERGLGVVLLSNAHGYPMAQLAMVALAHMLGEAPADLPFLRIERALERLVGSYESYRGTIRGEVTREGDLLRFAIRYHHEERLTFLRPLSLGEQGARFEAISGGRRLEVQFDHHDGHTDLLFERYKFRKRLP